MSGFTPFVIECLGFLAVFALADALTMPLRRAVTGHEHPDRGVLRIAKNLIGLISRPLAVLVLSELVLGILRLNPWMKECLLQIPHHITAWLSFWFIVLSIDPGAGLRPVCGPSTDKKFIIRTMAKAIVSKQSDYFRSRATSSSLRSSSRFNSAT